MNFRVQNIKKGYCEIWANDRPGQRYRRMAVIHRNNDGWRWNPTDYHMLPDFDDAPHGTRRECANDCMRTALRWLVEHAIERQPSESPHWHSPRRDALSNVHKFMWLFTFDEMEEIERRLKTFGEGE